MSKLDDLVTANVLAQSHTSSAITPQRLQNYSRLMQQKLDRGDTQAKKAYLRSAIAQIEVEDDKVRIIGEKASLAAVIAGNPPESAHVRGFVRKWRARRVSKLLTPPDSWVVGVPSLKRIALQNGPFRRALRLPPGCKVARRLGDIRISM
jgi:hypothetical protein